MTENGPVEPAATTKDVKNIETQLRIVNETCSSKIDAREAKIPKRTQHEQGHLQALSNRNQRYDIHETMSGLESYVNTTVSIITADGRNFVGTLKGFDQTINIILDESHERVYSMNAGIEQVVLGLHIIRGDNVAVIGQLDESIDSKLDFSTIRGLPLEPVVH
ncbi:AAEL003985-PA [Aedes aegypti]|uniref:U6 snRNA-associated Sm-like protein LSm8 n=2 Tax=Aedes aegypti TaxID=7159 RepID=Q17E06_AEDAE|nr:AAEL003985-PA [Aedes aegypti]